MKPHITIVGAGAVGATVAKLWGPCAQSITFWIQARHEAQVKAGFDFMAQPQVAYKLPPQTDLLVIAVASPALAELSGLDLSKAKPQMTVLLLAPGFNDRERMASHVPDRARSIVQGTIPFLAYLEGSPQVLKHWTPPFARMMLSEGDAIHQASIQNWFQASELSPRVDRQAAQKMLLPDLLLRVLVHELMQAQWDYDAVLELGSLLRIRNKTLNLLPAAAGLKKINSPSRVQLYFYRLILQPQVIRGLWWLMEQLAPFDFRKFIKTHFTKVELQMKNGIKELEGFQHSR